MLKIIFFIFAVILLHPFVLSAQKLEIGVNGGMVQNTPPSLYNDTYINFNDSYTKGGSSPTATLKIMYNPGKHWQAGISIGYVPLSYTAHNPIFFQQRTVSESKYIANDNDATSYKTYLANPAMPLQLEVNYRCDIGKFNIYSGISVGYFVLPQDYTPFWSDYYAYGHTGGLMGGVQFGGCWFFVPWCGLNMQMAMSYYESYELIALPVTAGLRFRM